MSDAIRNWLPITKRNRVALGFAVAALVMFVVWNYFPHYSTVYVSTAGPQKYEYEGLFFMEFWPDTVDPDYYLNAIKSPDIEGFLSVGVIVSLLLNALVVVTLVPLWKIIHASKYLTVPLGAANFLGGSVVLWFLYDNCFASRSWNAPYEVATLAMIGFSMWALAAALFIFKNELGLRNELEVEKTMGEENEM